MLAMEGRSFGKVWWREERKRVWRRREKEEIMFFLKLRERKR
jgi:hypothetical protein